MDRRGPLADFWLIRQIDLTPRLNRICCGFCSNPKIRRKLAVDPPQVRSGAVDLFVKKEIKIRLFWRTCVRG